MIAKKYIDTQCISVLFSPVFVYTESRSKIPTLSESAKFQRRPNSSAALPFSLFSGLAWPSQHSNLQPANIPTRSDPNSFPVISFADPHPLNSVVSYLYKNLRGEGPRGTPSHRHVTKNPPPQLLYFPHLQAVTPLTPLYSPLTQTAACRPKTPLPQH